MSYKPYNSISKAQNQTWFVIPVQNLHNFILCKMELGPRSIYSPVFVALFRRMSTYAIYIWVFLERDFCETLVFAVILEKRTYKYNISVRKSVTK